MSNTSKELLSMSFKALSSVKLSSKLLCSKTSKSSWLLYRSSGSKFWRKEPLNKKGSCGIYAINARVVFTSNSAKLRPPTFMNPSSTIFIFKNAFSKLDLPDPVLPTTAIFALEVALKFICFMIVGKSSLYLTDRLLISTLLSGNSF